MEELLLYFPDDPGKRQNEELDEVLLSNMLGSMAGEVF